jgi:hypothetical protein
MQGLDGEQRRKGVWREKSVSEGGGIKARKLSWKALRRRK